MVASCSLQRAGADANRDLQRMAGKAAESGDMDVGRKGLMGLRRVGPVLYRGGGCAVHRGKQAAGSV